MKLEEYEKIKAALHEENIIKYDILSYIEENIINDKTTFNHMFQDLDQISQKEEIIKMYSFIKKLNLENNPFIYTKDYKELLFEFKKYVINSTSTMKIIDIN